MSAANASNLVSVQTVRKVRVERAIDRIADQLREQHLKIEVILSRLTECLASVQIVERSVGATGNPDSVVEVHKALERAYLVSEDLSQELNAIDAGASNRLRRQLRP